MQASLTPGASHASHAGRLPASPRDPPVLSRQEARGPRLVLPVAHLHEVRVHLRARAPQLLVSF